MTRVEMKEVEKESDIYGRGKDYMNSGGDDDKGFKGDDDRH